jgi:hypothetical protein
MEWIFHFALQSRESRFEEESMQAAIACPAVPLGRIKMFGPVGEQYEVIRPLRPAPNGDWWVEIQMVKTSERAEYPLSNILEDPDGI